MAAPELELLRYEIPGVLNVFPDRGEDVRLARVANLNVQIRPIGQLRRLAGFAVVASVHFSVLSARFARCLNPPFPVC